MTEYNTLNVKMSHSQLNKLNSVIKNGTGILLKKFCQKLFVILMMRITFRINCY